MLSSKHSGGRSVLDRLYQSGSLKCLFPKAPGPGMQAMIVNTAGGVTGGDSFALDACAAAGTTLTLTTQACERAYRAKSGETGRICNRLAIEHGARINWLPQETILFRGCAIRRRLCIEMAEDATLVMAEPLVFGRAAMGERLTCGNFSDRIELRRNGNLLFLDAMMLEGDIAARLARAAIADGAGAMATLLYSAPDAETQLPRIRAALPETAGASLLRSDVLFLRLLAPDSHALRLALVPLLIRLSSSDLPRPWMI
ncbi:urease accessory protein [Rhodovulum imhoffii]|uniref:Urease accessory protein UreD n=1 Tax=Rhodovulum imhoffii TaxID=365340 RepID=A0A2T5BTX0_9RHOB|nr:urease accessory protein [Rhodovulum imhoffii]PTN02905.1 urease accessory protein [Rhodovulum imhoffii]